MTDIAPAAGPGDTAPINEFVVDAKLRVNDWFYLITPFPVVGANFANAVEDVKDGRVGATPGPTVATASGPSSPRMTSTSAGSRSETTVTQTASGPARPQERGRLHDEPTSTRLTRAPSRSGAASAVSTASAQGMGGGLDG